MAGVPGKCGGGNATSTEAQILTIFRGLLDDASVHRREADQGYADVPSEEFLVTLDLEFGGDIVTSLRTKWYGLRLKHQGSLRMSDWRNFTSQFQKLMRMVGDATDEEAERLFLRALTFQYQKRIEAEVEKQNRDKKLIIEGLPNTMGEPQVMAFIAVETGRQPRSVEQLPGGKWKVRCQDDAHRATAMRLNRQHLAENGAAGSGARLAVKQLEERLKVEGIDMLMRRWLGVDERVSHRSSQNNQPRPEEEKRQRFTCEVLAEMDNSEANEDDQTIVRVESPKAPTRPTEVHPKKGKGDGKGGHALKESPRDKESGSMAKVSSSAPDAASTSPPGVSGTAGTPQQQPHVSPQGPGNIQHWDAVPWGWLPPHPMCWDPSWGAGWHQGKGQQWPGKGSGGKGGKGKGAGQQGSGKGSGDAGKGADGKGKGGRGHH